MGGDKRTACLLPSLRRKFSCLASPVFLGLVVFIRKIADGAPSVSHPPFFCGPAGLHPVKGSTWGPYRCGGLYYQEWNENSQAVPTVVGFSSAGWVRDQLLSTHNRVGDGGCCGRWWKKAVMGQESRHIAALYACVLASTAASLVVRRLPKLDLWCDRGLRSLRHPPGHFFPSDIGFLPALHACPPRAFPPPPHDLLSVLLLSILVFSSVAHTHLSSPLGCHPPLHFSHLDLSLSTPL